MRATPLRVLLVDDQPHFRRAAAKLISTVAGLQLVGQAASGPDAVALAATLEAELVLMDVRMPGMDGLEATRQIIADRPTTRVVLVSTSDPDGLPTAVAACGAEAFVRKDDLTIDVLERLRGPRPADLR